MKDLKERTVSGGFAKLLGQAGNFALRICSTVILARLLDPKDFGLVAMATVVTGFYSIFTSAGLSSATVQRSSISDDQITNLFWINMLVGSLLALLCLPTAPALVSYYHEPRLLWVTTALAAGFLFNAAAVQHTAVMQRQMRFVALTVIDSFASFMGIVVGIAMAYFGCGYWAVVGMTLSCTITSTVTKWVVTGWIPGLPRRGVEVRSLLVYGGTITLNSVVMYVAYNLEKVLIGRFWGAAALGLYGRAYNLVNIPTENINVTVSTLAFSALSRVQEDKVMLRNYFLKGYSVVVSMTLLITVSCAVFADDLVFVLLGPKWSEAAVIFRLLTPTVLVFGLITPLGWLLHATGRQSRGLKIAFVLAPLIISSVVLGLPHGPRGVAFAYSSMLTLWVVPHLLWSVHDTAVSFIDLLRTLSKPFLSGLVATLAALPLRYYFDDLLHPFAMLAVGGLLMVGTYLWMLLIVMGQKEFYLNLMSRFRSRSSDDAKESGAASL
jgi:PST family polysaccharide transporter